MTDTATQVSTSSRTAWLAPFLPVLIVSLGAAIAFFMFPYDLAFLTRIVIMMIFVLSFDLILGYAGIATLGHAAMYGCGAYAAGLISLHLSPDPLIGLFAGAFAGALIAWISGIVLLRAQGVALLMISIAVTMVLQETASQARWLTGGADGLAGITVSPLLGMFEFDFVGQVAFIYCVCILIALLVFCRVLAASPFGLALRGIEGSASRMRAIGTPVYRRKVTVYVIAGAIAGIAGALAAQATGLVGIEVFNFSLSADVMVMLIVGGAGRLYGALIGTLIFMIVHHIAASIDPFNWLFVIGFMLLVVVFALPKGLVSLPDRLVSLSRRAS
ncbi:MULTISPECIES: branched-chain amino acid ABC transporter permease [Rhizobium]|uniref:branched-chain amino acid ABC transporter permease n=1 Tax=Rhizobium TaxID=379 RepID=UPI00234ECF46|nr:MULTISPECIES: branched-chain amino acid ABC transporter permease [unclassified Rhizobium]MDC7743708.1 branched-chain amino acid ABC transporter permease [Rhizobium sp. BC56]MDC9809799.1 branched-chain amino acid ABC transporter permease [Rhizobium sp. MC62]MDC9832886.1 branched-chain amino acid ABC transporter permease [Rhizobium sp. MJ37]WEA26677.1 branched-chain amino acid ABC transporter permease [Rhizobium sp. MJ22]WEA61178.1 branched-chain amino acid ABC transporter permease [Rhizobium